MSPSEIDTTEDDLVSAWDKVRYQARRTETGNAFVRMSWKDWLVMLAICEWWADERREAKPPAIPEI